MAASGRHAGKAMGAASKGMGRECCFHAMCMPCFAAHAALSCCCKKACLEREEREELCSGRERMLGELLWLEGAHMCAMLLERKFGLEHMHEFGEKFFFWRGEEEIEMGSHGMSPSSQPTCPSLPLLPCPPNRLLLSSMSSILSTSRPTRSRYPLAHYHRLTISSISRGKNIK